MKHTFIASLKEIPVERKQPMVIALHESHHGDHPFLALFSKEDGAYLKHAMKAFSASWLLVEKICMPSDYGLQVLLLGLGKKNEYTGWRRPRLAICKIISSIQQSGAHSCTVLLNDFLPSVSSSMRIDECAELMATDTERAAYAYTVYHEMPKKGWPALKEIRYVAKGMHSPRKMQQALERGACIGEQVNEARDCANTPGGDMTPRALAQHAKAQGKKYGFSVTVLNEKDMKKIGMGAVLGVSRGSNEEAQFIIMEYHHGKKNKKPIIFIGKGITFDSGGLNLKPTGALDEMHMDMSGGAAVIAAMGGIARLHLPVSVVGLVPAVENMPSGQSYRPGDVLKSMSGKSIEIANTDAEGRVVLADALTYAKKYNPSLVIDVATLTGACMVALAPYAAGVFSRDDALIEQLRTLGEKTGDYLWPLPLWEEYEEDLKGKVGDILNAKKSRDAGATNGALFLYQFAKDFPAWAHIDIASIMTTVPSSFLASGSRGAATALLIALAGQYNHQ